MRVSVEHGELTSSSTPFVQINRSSRTLVDNFVYRHSGTTAPTLTVRFNFAAHPLQSKTINQMNKMPNSYLNGLSNQTNEPPTNTPGPLSILFFFLVFILINHLVRRIFASSAIDSRNLNKQNDSRQGFSIEDDEEDNHDRHDRLVDESSQSSNDLIGMMIGSDSIDPQDLKPTDVSFSIKSNSVIETTLFERLSSSPTVSNNYHLHRSTNISDTWTDSHRNLMHRVHTINRPAWSDDAFEISDSCSSSTNSS